jgi:soluble lytic murein transglycosylase-like protein
MINRVFTATSMFARRKASQSAAWAVFARDTVSGFVTTAHHMLMLLGITAIGLFALMFVKPDLADKLKALSPFAVAQKAQLASAQPANPANAPEDFGLQGVALIGEPPVDDDALAGDPRQQERVTIWLSKRYRVATDATDMLVSAAYLTAKEMKLDPLLILSVMAIESRFNPFAESPVGAQGLMQVMSKVHRDKFEDHGGLKAALDPVANIRVGSQILKDYVARGGSIEAGLKLYVGAGAMETDDGYGAKVLAEYQRLKEVAKGKKVPIFTTSVNAVPPKPRPQEVKADTESESASVDGKATQDRIAAL